MNSLSLDKQLAIIAHLVEGNGIRATARLVGAEKKTVSRLALTVGEACQRLHDRTFRNLCCGFLQLDEQWSYVGKKQKRLTDGDPNEWGDTWTHVALDVVSRAVVTFLVGRRTAENADAFLADVRARVIGKPHLSTDGHAPYVNAVETAFGIDCTFGQMVKQYQGTPQRYVGCDKIPIIGAPPDKLITTSYVERSNLTVRSEQARFGRRTLRHSKDLRHHRAAVALHYCWYNFGRPHEAHRGATPAEILGVTSSAWSLGELVERALATPAVEQAAKAVGDALPEHSKWTGVSADQIPSVAERRRLFTVIPGGKK